MSLQALDEESLNDLYKWLESMPLSKKLRNISKDFSDAVLIAEIIAHYLPRYITLNNFAHVNSASLKRYNWETLDKDSPGIGSLEHSWFLRLLYSKSDPLNTMLSSVFDVDLLRTLKKNGTALLEHASLYLDHKQAEQYQNALNKAQGIENSDRRDSFSLTDEQIEALYSRIRYLESVIQQKEERIQALTQQVEKLLEIACRDPGPHHHPRHPADTPPSSEGQSSAYPTDSSSPFRDHDNPYDSYCDLK